MKTILAAFSLLSLVGSAAMAQKLGRGGTGVDENASLPECAAPLGTVALVEDHIPSAEDQLPPGVRALVQMAERQNGGASVRVDPLPLLKLLAVRSHCFQVVERGETFNALQKERALAAGGSVENGNALIGATLKAADYLLTSRVLYSDGNVSGGGGAFGGMFGSAMGLKTKTLEAQTMLTLVDVRTGIQQAVATGSARKKDYAIIGGGLLLNLGVGALGGGYTDTDPGKVLSLAMLDAYRKLALDAQRTIVRPQTAQPEAPGPEARK